MLWGRSVTWVFVVVWLGVGTAWLILDWLGNPNRGAFRPAKNRKPQPFRNGRAIWRRRRAEGDAAIRTTLRDRYGRSSLRIMWTQDREQRSIDADAELITNPLHVADPVLPEEQILLFESLLLDAQFDPPQQQGWTVGTDPFILTRAGNQPSKAIIRARVWKNLAAGHNWECENGQRMRSGKPPRRVNADSGKSETARVDLAVGLPFWTGESTDQFDHQSLREPR